MSKYRVRKIYEERYNNYVNNYHINQLRALDENAPAMPMMAPEPVSKDRLKNKNKQRQEPQMEIAIPESGVPQALFRPAWKVNAKYAPSTAPRLRLCMFDKAYERDSM